MSETPPPLTPIGLPALARWQTRVLVRGAIWAPFAWLGWIGYWTVRGWPR